jgi:hypothetical protein
MAPRLALRELNGIFGSFHLARAS